MRSTLACSSRAPFALGLAIAAGLLLTAFCALSLAAPAKGVGAVVVVDEVQTTSLALSPRARETMAEYLRTRLARLSGVRVIPADQVREARARQQQEQLARCGDGPCPVELGQLLAANKVLVSQLTRAGEVCLVTLTYLDVRTATDEQAASVPGGCSEGELVATISKAIDQLAAAIEAAAVAGQGPSSAPAEGLAGGHTRLVSVYFTSSPPVMPVSINGKVRGKTPIRIDLAAGESYEAKIGGRFPYETVTRRFVARDWQRIKVKLGLERVDPAEVASTPEWFGLTAGSGFVRAAERPLTVFGLRLATFRWHHTFLTLADLMGSVGFNDGKIDWSMLTVGPRGGALFSLGKSGKHQLLLGSGLCYANFDAPEKEGIDLLTVTPGLEYVYMASNGSGQVGAGAQLTLPLAGAWPEGRWPLQATFYLRFGFSLTPQLHSATWQKEQEQAQAQK